MHVAEGPTSARALPTAAAAIAAGYATLWIDKDQAGA